MNDIDPPLPKKHFDSAPMKTIVKEDFSNLNDWLVEFRQQLKNLEEELFLDLGFNKLSDEQLQEIKDYIFSREFESFEESKAILTEVFSHWIKSDANT